MAKSEKILAYVSTLKKFESALEIFGSDYYDNSVVFIEDTQQIYTHGTYFDGGGINWQELHDGILEKGEERFKIWYCTQSEFESYSTITPNILSIVNYIVTAGEFALGMIPGETAIGTRLFKGDTLLRLIMDEMLLENDIILDEGVKISPDNFPGVIMQLFKVLKEYVTTGDSVYWGDTYIVDSSIADPGYNSTWGNTSQINSAGGNSGWNEL